MPIERIVWDKQDVVRCDERGRATLGSEFAGEQVFVYVARPPDFDDYVEPSPEEKQVLSKMATWANENVDEWFDLKPREGVVVDKHGDEYECPHSYESS